MIHEHVPWVEKYRPSNFESIVLEPNNKKIFQTMLKTNYFPNILVYGPPGTGKTTTIMNLVTTFQKQNDQMDKGLLIHLNASDERGIDVIRTQIYQFVNSHTLFSSGTKIVILDEVDYMTKNAQHALKNILCGVNGNVRFFLICNYISRIEESLQNEFVRLRFNQLPDNKIAKHLKHICDAENISIEDNVISSIRNFYKSDIRSMINHIQCNQSNTRGQKAINNDLWETFTSILRKEDCCKEACNFLHIVSKDFNIEICYLIKHYLNYVLRNKKEYVNLCFMKTIEFVTHTQQANIEHIQLYTILKLNSIYRSQDLYFIKNN